MRSIRQLVCAVLHMHEWMIHREPRRMRVQCLRCGLLSTGIEVGGLHEVRA